MIKYLLDILNIVKVYHFLTKSGYKHEISGKLYEKLSELFDLYIETYIGFHDDEINITGGFDLVKFEDEDFIIFLIEVEEQLEKYADAKNYKSLITILDDCRVELRHYIYLLKKS